MKPSDKPTEYLLLKAGTNSEWDNCDFAIIHITEDWKKEQKKRLKVIQPFADDYHFQSVNYYDTAVDFYKADDEGNPNLDSWLADKTTVFIELDKEELETLSMPENSLDCYRLAVSRAGAAQYTAYGKHTGEEFWTEEFNLNLLCNLPEEETELERLCRERFKHLSNKQLVERLNGLPAFKRDDESMELQRRRKVSNGSFDYEFRGNTMVILKNENL